MNKLYVLLFSFLAFVVGNEVAAQCDPGEVEVEILVQTDAYGYEAYWSLTPNGNDCGEDELDSGGNNAVGCDGAGAQDQAPGGYDDFDEVTEGPWCVLEGTELDLHYIDDWGDGGFTFIIMINGFIVDTYNGVGEGGVRTFTAAEPAQYDVMAIAGNLDGYVAMGEVEISTTFFNNGIETITSFDFNYSVNGGDVVTDNITGASLENAGTESFMHGVLWNASSEGSFTIEMWASNLNGNADMVPENDAISVEVEVGPGIPNIIDQYIGVEPVITTIANSSDQVNKPTDLDFHPVLSRNELWVVNRDTENTGGSTVTILNAGEANQNEIWKRDGNAWHFMSLPNGIAFSSNGNFGTASGVFDANHQGTNSAFTGPALWSSELDIYAEPSGGNGSHLDMLHASPYNQGIAAETGNAFWIIDGYSDDICRYDFKDDHGPGNDDHSDGEIFRYADDEVARDPDFMVVSHLELDDAKQWLYVVDHGNQRVIRIDINTGTLGGTPSYGPYEQIAEYKFVTGYTQETVVSTGLDKPAGIDIVENRMIVSEFESGEIIIYDISSMPAVELDRIETGFSSLQGIKIGPDGKIWGVDYDSETVYRVDGGSVSTNDVVTVEPRVFPNPSANIFYVENIKEDAVFRLFDLSGALISEQSGQGQRMTFDLSQYASGIYSLQIVGESFTASSKLVKL